MCFEDAAPRAMLRGFTLQEASIADISYLFQEGAVVDFKVDPRNLSNWFGLY